MQEDWKVYLMMFIVVSLILLGKKMMISDFKKDKDDKPKDN